MRNPLAKCSVGLKITILVLVCSIGIGGTFLFWPEPPKDALQKALETKDTALALKYYGEFLDDPNSDEREKILAYWFRGNLHRKIGDYKKAITDYSDGIRIEPNHLPMMIGRAIANLALGQCKKAEHDIQRLDHIRHIAHSVPALRASHFFCIGLKDKGFETLDNAILIFPKSAKADLHGIRGEFHHREGNLKLALKDYREAIRFGATSKRALNRLEQIRIEIKQKQR